MQVADKVHQQHQRLFLVLDGERRRHGPALEHGDGRADRGDDVMVVGALLVAIEAVALDGNVVEMVGAMAIARHWIGIGRAVEPISLDVVYHPLVLRLGVAEQRAWHFVDDAFVLLHLVDKLPSSWSCTLFTQSAHGPTRRNVSGP